MTTEMTNVETLTRAIRGVTMRSAKLAGWDAHQAPGG